MYTHRMCSFFFFLQQRIYIPLPPSRTHPSRLDTPYYVCVCVWSVYSGRWRWRRSEELVWEYWRLRSFLTVPADNYIGAEGAKALAAALERNSTLKSLHLGSKCQSSSSISDGSQILFFLCTWCVAWLCLCVCVCVCLYLYLHLYLHICILRACVHTHTHTHVLLADIYIQGLTRAVLVPG